MFTNLNISRIREAINKEKLYILMLSFILLFNALIIFSEKIPGFSKGFLKKKISLSGPAEKQTEEEFTLKIDKKVPWDQLLQNKKHVALINIFGLGAVFIFGLGLFLDIRILIAKAKKRTMLKSCGRHLGVKWGIGDIFKLVLIFVFCGYILQIIETQLFSFVSSRKDSLRFLPLLNTGILDLVLLVFVVYFVTVKYRQRIAAVGLKMKDAGKLVFWAILSYIAFIPVLVFLLLFLVMLAALFNYQPPPQTLFKLFLQEKRLWLLLYSTLMIVLLGPIVEEVFFRGFSYNAIKRKWGRQTAMLLTAVVFAGLHGNLIGFLPIAALGLLLVYVYEKTSSLIPAITIHILHNSLMVGFLFLARYIINLSH